MGSLKHRCARELYDSDEAKPYVDIASGEWPHGTCSSLPLIAHQTWCRPLPQRCTSSTMGSSAVCTFNISGNVATYPHKDFMNHAPNWCAITALGRFNPDRGGHIILWEYRLIVRFPPGSTICIPSATVTHSNVQVARGEVRMSFTQYTAAGLFRWAACKFQSMQDFSKNHPEEKQRMDDSVEKRVEDGLRLYMKASDLRAMQLPG